MGLPDPSLAYMARLVVEHTPWMGGRLSNLPGYMLDGFAYHRGQAKAKSKREYEAMMADPARRMKRAQDCQQQHQNEKRGIKKYERPDRRDRP